MNIAQLKREVEKAYETKNARAALGSIVGRHYDEIKPMSQKERLRFLATLGYSKNYLTEIGKELARVEYDQRFERL